jgi:glycosyltransferase involved in cell wall biosynthesis
MEEVGNGNEGRMSEPLNVTHVVLSMDLGGLERVVLDLVRAGQGFGQRVAVACTQRPGSLAPRVEALGARLAYVGKTPGSRLKAIAAMKALLRELRPDVVHTHQAGALLYAGPAARGAGVPAVVHTEHGKHYPGHLRTRVIGRLSGGFASRYFCVSQEIAATAVAHHIVPSRKVHVVPNGIDTARFARRDGRDEARRAVGLPAGATIIGTVGRLSEIKRQDLLIRAFARAAIPGALLLLVGDGPMMDSLRGLASGLGLGESVRFAGYQDEPERYVRAMDVFALTSRSEGMPLAVLEAWAAGVPVVASRVGGLPEMIDDGRTGLLFEPDDEAALASVLAALGGDPERCRRVGEAGLERVRSRFDVRVMAETYERHYREILSRRGVAC